jgi:hypothetical protein
MHAVTSYGLILSPPRSRGGPIEAMRARALSLPWAALSASIFDGRQRPSHLGTVLLGRYPIFGMRSIHALPRLVLLTSTIAGCAYASVDQLRVRAAHDLDCPEGNLHTTQIDAQTLGVEGCGQRATYVETCDGRRDEFTTQCTWVLNTPITTQTSDHASEPAATDDCNPPCSPGFSCNQGQCIAQCNPPCPEAMWCSADRTCKSIPQRQPSPSVEPTESSNR